MERGERGTVKRSNGGVTVLGNGREKGKRDEGEVEPLEGFRVVGSIPGQMDSLAFRYRPPNLEPRRVFIRILVCVMSVQVVLNLGDR